MSGKRRHEDTEAAALPPTESKRIKKRDRKEPAQTDEDSSSEAELQSNNANDLEENAFDSGDEETEEGQVAFGPEVPPVAAEDRDRETLELELAVLRSANETLKANVSQLLARDSTLTSSTASASSNPISFIAHSAVDVHMLTEFVPEQVDPFCMQWRGAENNKEWHNRVSPKMMEVFSTIMDAEDIPESEWRKYTNQQFCDRLKLLCPPDRSSSSLEFYQRMVALPWRVSASDMRTNETLIGKIVEVELQTSSVDIAKQQKAVIAMVVKDKFARSADPAAKFLARKLGKDDPSEMPVSMREMKTKMLKELLAMHKAIQHVSQFATVTCYDKSTPAPSRHNTTGGGSAQQPVGGNNPRTNKDFKPKDRNARSTASVPNNSTGTPSAVSNCYMCGRPGHNESRCDFRKADGSGSWHPNANTSSSTPWAQSQNGIKFAEKNINVLPFTMDLAGNTVRIPDHVKNRKNNKPKGEILYQHLYALKLTNTDDYLSCDITLPQQEQILANNVLGLLDNGALGVANYVSIDVAAKLLAAGGTKSSFVSKTIRSAFTTVHGNSEGSIRFDVLLTSEQNDESLPIRLSVDACIIDSPIDLILGRNIIKEHNLVHHFPSHFILSKIAPVEAERYPVCDDGLPPRQPRSTTPLLTSMKLRNLNEEDPVFNSDYHVEAFEAFESVIEPPDTSIDVLDLITIETDDELQESDVKAFLQEYRDIFSETLPREPADLPPLELDVDRSTWEQPKHSLPPRVQSPANQIEIRKQLDLFKQQNIIRSSDSPHYSQVHLAEKPPKGSGKKRFCIDYVLLNLCTKTVEKWPLPNIQQMLHRLGDKRPKYFAVLDLTSGYHQAPVSMSSIAFTAFICFAGIYEFLRVPFGLKGAPSYFQKALSNVVLVGLLYIICELYIDDIIVHATTAAEFLSNLRAVFDRIRKHRLVLSPRKVRIGLREVEYTGHVISRDGLSFSPTKIKSVLDFPLPTKKRQIKQFIGLANYFRDHVKNHSGIVAALQAYVSNYTTKQANVTVTLSEEAINAFNTIKAAIENCPTLFFLDDTSKILLFTDACNYGLGGYLVQLVPDSTGKLVERPIAFMSKSLSATQLKWDIPQKECYAIYCAIHKFEYLLRDRKFIIKTDHKNITFLNNSALSSIRKNKIYISEFDHEFDFTRGEDNVVADLISRLVEEQAPDVESDPVLFLLALPAPIKIPLREYNLISKVHNSLVGHHGVERTLSKLLLLCSARKVDPWANMKQHIKQFIKQCPCCQKMNVLKTPIVAHPFTTSSYLPMERLNIDYIGPFPDGKYILAILDCFSRWVELSHCEHASADETARALLSHIGRYGAPMQLLSDRGSHFVNEVIKQLLLLIGPEQCLTIAYSKEESALIERENKEINRHLRAFFFDRAIMEEYITCIPLVQRILNASTTRRTGLPPCKLLFGNMIDLDRGIFIPQEAVPPSLHQSLSQRMSKMLHLQAELMRIAEQSIRDADNTHIASHSAHRTEFPVDSFVLLDYPSTPPTRLHTRKKGPFKVLRFSGNDYVLQDLVSFKEQTVNITRLSPFVYDPLHTDPRQIANKDQSAFDIEKVLTHRGNLNSKGTLEFLIKWVGFDDSHDSWEPWANVRTTKQLHAYLRDKGLTTIIPKQFR